MMKFMSQSTSNQEFTPPVAKALFPAKTMENIRLYRVKKD